MSETDDLPAPTAPDTIPVSVRGFTGTEEAERFAHVIANAVRAISRFIDLDRLDGITVAYDYDDALAQLDRGYTPTRTLTRTSSDQMLGVAMAPAVVRDGVVKEHLVFHAPFVLPLERQDGEELEQALYLVAHECAHIEDLKHRDTCFPGTILQRQITDYEEALFEPIIGALWEEYAACRVSARFGAAQAARYEECFVGVLQGARVRANEAIRAYRLHGDLNRVLEEAGRPLCEPLRMAAYLIGHLDGRGEDLDAAPQAQALLATSAYAPLISQLREALRTLWSRRGAWSSPAEFQPLAAIASQVLSEGGMTLTRLPSGNLHVDIPYTPETLPI